MIDPIPDLMVLEDSGSVVVPLTGITDGDTGADTLAVFALSFDPARVGLSTVIPAPVVAYTSPATTGSLTLAPAQDAFGSAVVDVVVCDSLFCDVTSFDATVSPVNDSPTIGPIGDLSIAEDASITPVVISGIGAGPGETQTLTVTALSDNPSVLPSPTVLYTSADSSGVLLVAPAANATGTARITVTVVDDGGTSNGGVDTTSTTFEVEVGPVNDAPTVPDLAFTAAEGGSVAVGLTGDDPDGDPLTFSIVAGPAGGTLSGSPPALTYTPKVGFSGSDFFTYKANDGTVDSNIGIVLISVVPAPTRHFLGLVDPAAAQWQLQDGGGTLLTFTYGNPGDVGIIGDWDCDGVETPGVWRPSNQTVYLRNSNTQGVADISFRVGNSGDVPVAGDFNGDGCDTVGVQRPAEAKFYLFNALAPTGGGLLVPDLLFTYGNPFDQAAVGDFDGDGTDTIAVYRASNQRVFIRNTNTSGAADFSYIYGNRGDVLLFGDWTRVDFDAPAVFRPGDATFYLRFTNTFGVADDTVPFPAGSPDRMPVAGRFFIV